MDTIFKKGLDDELEPGSICFCKNIRVRALDAEEKIFLVKIVFEAVENLVRHVADIYFF